MKLVDTPLPRDARCDQRGREAEGRPWREGVYYDKPLRTDLFVVTLDNTHGHFSPTTRYRDYAISRDLIHWESQSGTPENSPTA